MYRKGKCHFFNLKGMIAFCFVSDMPNAIVLQDILLGNIGNDSMVNAIDILESKIDENEFNRDNELNFDYNVKTDHGLCTIGEMFNV